MSRTYRGMYRHADCYRLAVRRRRSRLIAAALKLAAYLFPPEPPCSGRASW